MNQIIVNRSKIAMAVLFIFCSALLLATLYLATKLRSQDWLAGISVEVLFLGFSGTCFWISCRQLLSRKAGIVIDRDGFSVDLVSVELEKILWADVTKISEWQGRGKATLLVFVKEPNKYIQQLKGLNRLIAKGNRAMSGTPIFLSTLFLEMGGADLQILLEQRLEQFRQSHT
jgi:hypothetical protein